MGWGRRELAAAPKWPGGPAVARGLPGLWAGGGLLPWWGAALAYLRRPSHPATHPLLQAKKYARKQQLLRDMRHRATADLEGNGSGGLAQQQGKGSWGGQQLGHRNDSAGQQRTVGFLQELPPVQTSSNSLGDAEKPIAQVPRWVGGGVAGWLACSAGPGASPACCRWLRPVGLCGVGARLH